MYLSVSVYCYSDMILILIIFIIFDNMKKEIGENGKLSCYNLQVKQMC